MGPLVFLGLVGLVAFGGPEPFRALVDLLLWGRFDPKAITGAGLVLAFYLTVRSF